MPTYEYACKACGHLWEEIQKMSDPAVEVCPSCGATKAGRLISHGNFILKGGGWYTTGGYGAPAKKGSGEAEKKGGGDDDKGGGGGKGGDKSEKIADKGADKKTESPAAPASTESKPSSGGETPSKGQGQAA